MRKNSGATVGTRRAINFIEGSGVAIEVTDSGGSEAVNVTISGGLPAGCIVQYGGSVAPTG